MSMGLPDETVGLPKKRSRLGLNSKRKEIQREACEADEHKHPPHKGMNNLMATISDVLEEGPTSSASVQQEMSFPDSRGSVVAPVSSLYNLGNTCFLNCMLQVLRYTPGFLSRLTELLKNIQLEEKRMMSRETKDKMKNDRDVWKLVTCLDSLYRQMQTKERDYPEFLPTDAAMMAVRPDALLDQIRLLNPLFEGNFQHDAQELLRCLLSCLDDAEVEVDKLRAARSKPDSHINPHSDTQTTPLIKDKIKPVKAENTPIPALPAACRKRKTKKKTEENTNPGGITSPIMANFLNKKKRNDDGVTAHTDEGDCKLVKAEEDEEEDDSKSLEDIKVVRILKPDKGDGILKEESQLSEAPSVRRSDGDVNKIETLWDAVIAGKETGSGKGIDHFDKGKMEGASWSNEFKVKHTPFTYERKRMRLGVRGSVVENDLHSKNVTAITSSSSSVLKEKTGEANTKKKSIFCADDEVVTISDDDEDAYDKIKDLPPDDSMDQVSWEFDKTVPSADGAKGLSSEGVTSSQAGEGGGMVEGTGGSTSLDDASCSSGPKDASTNYVLSPGKKLTIHSPQGKSSLNFSPKLPMSKSFLSRIQGFLPHSAKKYLNFSSCPTENSQPMIDSTSTPSNLDTIDLTMDDSQEGLPNTPPTKDAKLSEPMSQHYLQEAKLQLKRCDWLGVSPVKPISACFVMEQVKNDSNPSVPNVRKRKSSDDSRMNDEPFKKQCSTLGIEEKQPKLIDHKGDAPERPDHCKTMDESETQTKGWSRKQTENANKRSQNSTRNRAVAHTSSPQIPDRQMQSALKPLSIQLRKLDWLMDSGQQSFNVKDILHNDVSGRRWNLGGRRKRQSLQQKQDKQSDTPLAPPPDTCLAPPSGQRDTACCGTQDKPKPGGERLVQGLFGGVMGHRTCCCECEGTSDRSEAFLDVSIPVRTLTMEHRHAGSSDDEEDNTDKGNSVFHLLKSFSSRERLCNDNKYFCDSCFHLVEAERFCFFQELPKILAIHLKRFDAGLGSLMGQVSKISDHVSVPACLPCLRMQCASSGSCCRRRYSLYGVVTHSGSSIRRGHYRAYVKVSSPFNPLMVHYNADTETFRTPSPSMTSACPSSPLPSCDLQATSIPNGLVGDTLHDLRNPALMYSGRMESASCDTGGTGDPGSGDTYKHRGIKGIPAAEGIVSNESWWLECDDEFIRVFEQQEFLDRLSGEEESLLGTPYVLFYHQA